MKDDKFTGIASKKGFADLFAASPERVLFWLITVIAVLWTVQCTLLQPVLGRDILETVTWGATWQLGHTKHPPLSGWIGYLTALASSWSNSAMYFIAQISLVIGVYYTWKLAREYFDRHEAALAALLLYTLYYYNPSSMKFCSHFVEAAFMPAFVYYFIAGTKRQHLADWLLFGVFGALAILGKYAAWMVLFACFLYMLFDPEARKSFRKPGAWLGAAVMLALVAPHLVWLAEHDFCCLRHLERRVDDDPVPWYWFLLVIGTALLPLAIQSFMLLLAHCPWRRGELERVPVRREGLKIALFVTGVPAAILLAVAVSGRDVVLMWFSFLASWTGMVAVGVYPYRVTPKLFRNVCIVTALYTLVMLVGTTVDMLWIPRLRCHTDPAEVVRAAQEFYRNNSGGKDIPFVIGDRWLAGVVQFYAPNHPKSFDVEDVVTIAAFREELRKQGALVVAFPRKLKKFPPELRENLKFGKFTISSRALFGKTDETECCWAIWPGGDAPPRESTSGNCISSGSGLY